MAGSMAAAAACGGGSGDGRATLTWWMNPDPDPPAGADPANFGQPGIAKRCSTDEYKIETEQLPTSASEQRIQLARRLAADDSSIDLMSLDPVFTAEFAVAGFLAPIPREQQRRLRQGTLQGAVDGAMWEDELVVAPLWANTQVLWYRKSTAREAGLDMSQPVTWDQIIEAAVDTRTTVGVQGNKYEGYVVWINALIAGAGGSILTKVEEGKEATVNLDTQAATEAARIIQKLADSRAAQSDLSVSNEGTVLGPFEAGGFQVNWTFVYANYGGNKQIQQDLGWARYPRTVEDQRSKPPIGGINIGIGAFSPDTEHAREAVDCITSEENQIRFAVQTGQMPAREAAYEDPALTEQFPRDLLNLYRRSIESAGPRPATPYWSTVVNAILGSWHPPGSVDPQSTPDSSDSYIRDVLDGDALT